MEKNVTEFYRTGYHKSGKIKYRGNCNECSKSETNKWRSIKRAHYNKYMADYRSKNPDKFREIDLKRLYGLSLEKYMEMISAQNGTCALCEKAPSGKRPLAVDHCHTTGKIRGLLCYKCNRDIAILDNKEHLQKALNYLAVAQLVEQMTVNH